MNGVQFFAINSGKLFNTIYPPTKINAASTLILTATMTLFTLADSDTPTINKSASTMQMRNAGRLKIAVTATPSTINGTPSRMTACPVGPVNCGGMTRPKSASKLTT